MTNQIEREVLFDETVNVGWRLCDLDLEALRRSFATVFERAAHAVQVAGYEQDDAVIERYLRCRVGGSASVTTPPVVDHDIQSKDSVARDGRRFVDVAADALSDRSRMIEAARAALSAHLGHSPDPSDIVIVGLRVVATREYWPA